MKSPIPMIQDFFKNSKDSTELMKQDFEKQKEEFEKKGYHKDIKDWENFKNKENFAKTNNEKKTKENETNSEIEKFKKEENNIIFNNFFKKEIDFDNNLSDSDKKYIINRIFNRLATYIDKYDKNGIIVPEKETLSFFERSVERLNTPPRKKRKKGEGIFNTSWGENIYRKYGFLGAELNKDKTFSALNQKIIAFIKNNEKLNKKPSDNQINKFISKIVNQTDKQGMNDYQKIYRKSLTHILKAVSLYSQTIYVPYKNTEKLEGIEVGDTLNALTLQVDVKTLSECEIELISNSLSVSSSENNTLFIEIGSIKESQGSLHAEMAELLGLKECIEILYQENKNITSDKENEVENYIEELNEVLQERKDEISENFKKNQKNKNINEIKINKKKKMYNIGILATILISVAILIKKMIA